MTETSWTVKLVSQARKALKDLPKGTRESLVALLKELELLGPHRHEWPNFSKLKVDIYHCHIEKGRPTYVVCWRVNKKQKLIEVYYAGTHEKAPY
jgi:mRNA-degrading endonuclease RelE of RelBE toxin-antitoxin system